MDPMGEGASWPDPALPSDAGGEATRTSWGHYPVTRPGLADPANPPFGPATDVAPGQTPTYSPPPSQPRRYGQPAPQPPTYSPPPPQPPTYIPRGPQPPTYISPRPQPPTYIPPGAQPTYIPAGDAQPPSGIVRYGPGVPASVPASQAGPEAERVWRTGHLPEPSRRPLRLRRLLGSALTVILLAASGVVLYLHFYHAPFRVTGVEISQQLKNGCVDDVTGRITTNGAAGTVSYQWVFRPGRQAPQPLSQSVVGGQHALYVTAVVEGQGHGSASQTATLQVLGPDQGTASTGVIVRC